MGHDVESNLLDSFSTTDEGFKLCPFCLGLLRFGKLVLIQIVIKLLDEALAFITYDIFASRLS